MSDKDLVFSFGDPETVLGSSLGDYLGLFRDPVHDYYVPPISQSGLAKLLRANGHHGTIPYFCRNMVVRWYLDSPVLRRAELGKAAFDRRVFGHCYLQKIKNRLGQILELRHLPAVPMRRMKEPDRYCMLISGQPPLVFEPGEVIQLREYDPCQSIYGIPQYIGGIHSVLLNEDATLFRRKYFRNGAHMGYVFYVADGNIAPEDEEELKKQMKSSKGVGNFRSMYLNLPGGREKSVQIIPVGDIATKDEFDRVKAITRSDVLAMWRINGALAGILPDIPGGFGDLDKITRNHFENEVMPDQQVFLALNEFLPREKQIKFETPNFLLPAN